MDEINQETKSNAKWVIRISRKKFIITVIVIVLAAWWIVGRLGSFYSVNTMMYGGSAPSASAPGISSEGSAGIIRSGLKSSMMPVPQYYDGNQQSISDTREFLKTSFSANIKTRDVAEVTKNVKNIIKGADGRIDNFYSSEKSGRISFVVAKSKFDAFRDEIEAITHKKLYSETISSQNLLSQKQSIEEQTSNITNALDSLNKQKQDLEVKHAKAISTIKSELNRIQDELAIVRADILKISSTTDLVIATSLGNQETSLINDEAAQRQKLNIENSNYSNQKQNLENAIANYNSSLENVNEQDVKFGDNIETVNGNIYVNWVSLWDLAKIFFPIHPTIIIIILVVLIWIILKRKGYLPGVEWK